MVGALRQVVEAGSGGVWAGSRWVMLPAYRSREATITYNGASKIRAIW